MKETNRQLYKMNYLTKLLDITPRTIRYYDQLNLLPHIKRSDGGIRLFDDEDIQIIKKIRKLQKVEHLPLEAIREHLFGNKSKSSNSKKVVLSDSTIALLPELQKELNIQIIPLKITIGKETFLENKISTAKLWEKSKNLRIQPQTSPPSEAEFIQKYLDLYEKGYREIYSVHIASSLSDTFLNAQKAAHKVADRVQVYPIDSRSGGPGHRAFVIELAQAIKQDFSDEEIDLLITKMIPLNYVIMVSNTIRHLFSNINLQDQFSLKQQYLIDKLFDFKPLITFKGSTGQLDIVGWYKDKTQALDYMMEEVSSEIKNRGNYAKRIYIDYNYLYGEAVDLINSIKTLYRHTEVHIQEGSSIFSTYLGPETISISIS